MRKKEKEPAKIILDPVHRYIPLSRCETELIDTLPLQRLRGIKQLGLTSLVYPSATHTRFSHSMGTLYLARIMTEKLNLDSEAKTIARMSALLHDIGHGPFTLSSEEVIGSNEIWISKLLKESSELNEIIENEGFSSSDIAKVLSDKDRSIVGQILHCDIGADRLDYLVRDSYFTGLETSIVDVGGIVNSLEQVDKRIAFRQQRLYNLESFLMAFHMLYQQVYLHRTVRIVDLISLRVLQNLRELFDFLNPRTLEDFLRVDDAFVMVELQKYLDDKSTPSSIRLLIDALLHRRLPKCVYESELRGLHTRTRMSMLSNSNYRKEIEQEIAHKLKIEPKLIFVDFLEFTSPKEPILVTLRDKVSEISEVSEVFQSISRYFGSFCRVYAPQKQSRKATKAVGEVLRTKG